MCRLGLLGAPTLLDGRLVLAQALLALRRYDEVLAEMRVALEVDSKTAAAHALKGEALLRKGDVHAAREALMRAKGLAPGDPSISALVAETEVAIASGGSKLPASPVEAATKHYPTHRGTSPEGRGEAPRPTAPARAPVSSSFTKPAAPPSSSFTKPEPIRGRAGYQPPERTGTMEIDPDESGIELVDDDLGDVIDPPSPVGDDTGVLEVDDLDMVEDSVSGPRAQPAGKPKQAPRGSDDTRGGKPRHVAKATAVTVASAEAEGRRGARDDNTGALDLLLGELAGPPGASAAAAAAKNPPMPLRAPPTGAVPVVEPRAKRPSVAPPPAEDMRTIRAGLGLDPDSRLPSPRRGDDSTGIVIEPGRPSAPASPGTETGLTDSKRKERTRKVQTDPGGRTIAPPKKKSRAKLIVGVILSVAVIVGGVFVGFWIQDLLLQRDIAEQQRNARLAITQASSDRAKELGDSWKGWREARDIHEGIVKVDGRPAYRAELARVRAVLAADFGDDVDGARAAVAGLAGVTLVDAEVARAYVAMIDGDDAALATAAAALAEAAPGSTDASYVAGRAALLGEKWDAAIAAFDQARVEDTRAASLIGLAQAHAGKGAWPDARAAIELALAQHPSHEAVIVARARIIAAGPDAWASEAADLEAALEQLLTDSAKPLDEQARGVSTTQAAWASLALAEIQIKRGDAPAARRSLGRARAGGVADRTFAVGVIRALLAVGDVATARQEAEEAAKKWPAAATVMITSAQVALAEGHPDKVITALDAAGDLATHPEALALRGQAHLALGHTDPAKADLDAALRLAPELEAALVARAELDLADGTPRLAVTRLEKKYAAGATADLAVTYAAALRGVGERDRARTVLAELTGASSPSSIAGRAWLETARLERDGGDARAARAAYTKAIELLADATGAHLEAALLAVDSGDAEGARTTLDRLAVEAADDGRVLVEAARVHVLVGDHEGAKALLDRADSAKQPAPRWQIARERGRLAFRQRNFPVAIEALERAVSLDTGDGETRLLLIDAHLAAGDAKAAGHVRDDVMKGFAGLPVAQLAAGRVRLYTEALADAREAFLKAKDQLEREHGAPRWIAEATFYLGVTTYYDGDAIKARALLTQAIALDPSLADAYMQLGTIDGEKQSWKAAIKWYTKVTVLDPANHEAWFFLGEAALAAKQKVLAKKALQTYKQRAPTGDNIDTANKYLSKL